MNVLKNKLKLCFSICLVLLLAGCGQGPSDSVDSSGNNSTVYVALSLSDTFLQERSSSVTLNVSLTEMIDEVCSVNLTFSGTATIYDDYLITYNDTYLVANPDVLIPADQSSVNINIIGLTDGVLEGSETIIIDINSISPSDITHDNEQTQSIHVIDADEDFTVSLTSDRSVIAEGGDAAIIVATLSQVTTQDVFVALDIGSDSTADLDTDFVIGESTLIIESGSLVASTSVQSLSDDGIESIESIVVDILTVTNSLEDGDQSVTIDLVDESYDFKITWQTIVDNQTLEIPLYSGETYGFSVRWGDGSYEYFSGDDLDSIDHQYSTVSSSIEVSITPLLKDADGEYTLGFPRIDFSVQDNPTQITGVTQWGVTKWSSMSGAFSGCTNLVAITASDVPDLSLVTDVSNMFYGASQFNSDLDWDMVTITDMSEMFQGATVFNGDISGWDVSNVTSMKSLFHSATAFNGDVSAWDTSSVTNMLLLFYNASSFNGDVSSWDTSSVTDMSYLFYGASEFSGDVSSWDTGLVTNMSMMFYSASNFNSDLSSWDVRNVESMRAMFFNASLFNSDLGDWDTGRVTETSNMFYGASSFNSDLDDWDLGLVTNMDNMFYQASEFNGDIGSWDVSSVTSMTQMFYEAQSFSQDLSNWDMSAVVDLEAMFYNAQSFNGDVSSWDTSSVTNMRDLFYNATNFNGDVSSWNVAEVTDMSYMFYNATSFNGDVSSWDISGLSSIYSMNFIFYDSGMNVCTYSRNIKGWSENEDIPTGLRIFNDIDYSLDAVEYVDSLESNSSWVVADRLDNNVNCGL